MYNSVFYFTVVLCGLAYLQKNTFTNAAYCSGSPDPGVRTNDFPIITEAPTFIRSVKNAKLFEAGPANARFSIVHVWGNPYEVGFAQGTLQSAVIKEFVYSTWKYLSEEVLSSLDGLKVPEILKKIIVQKGMDKALDWTAEVTKPFTSQAYFDEIQGLSDATNVPFDLLYKILMFPELTKAHCSFFGAWGKATGDNGETFQLRALDFDTVGPFKDFPQVTIYHPSEGYSYANVGWPASIGLLTGFSSQQLAISEIGVSFADDSFGQGTLNTGPEKVKGEPWMFVLRDVLQFESSLQAAKDRIANSNRTCNLIIGVGDGKQGMVNGIEYSGYVSIPYDDETLLPQNDTWHPKIEDVVYNGMDWLCPSFTSALGEQLSKYYGAINVENTVLHVLPTVQTGNLHAAIYDLTRSTMALSFCRKAKADPSEPEYAYERQFTQLQMNEIFAVEPPNFNMSRNVCVAAIQMPCNIHKTINVNKAKELVIEASKSGANIILLQELFQSLYFCQEQKEQYFDWAIDGNTIETNYLLKEFSNLAKELHVVLPISFFEKCNNVYYNSIVVIDENGESLGLYRKSHIPDGPGYQEKFYFTPGDTGFKVFPTTYGQIGIAICWDQWFPEAARLMVLQGAEILLYPAAIGSEPENISYSSTEHWKRTMIGHSAANMVPIIVSNRVGKELFDNSEITFYGSSFITNNFGEILKLGDSKDTMVLTAEFDLTKYANQRASWGLFRDRRPDLYHNILTKDGKTK